MGDFPDLHTDSPVPAMELEKYLIHPNKYGEHDIPEEMLELVNEEGGHGVPTGIAKHPEHGYFVLQTSGQGPYIVMRQLSEKERQRVRDYFERANPGDGILTEEQCKKFVDLVCDETILRTDPIEIVVEPVSYDEEGGSCKMRIELPDFDFAGPYGYEGLIDFTCEDCQFKYLCPYSYDPYNTDGDCLASK